MNYFPAFFDLKGRPVLLVGGGEAAARRLRLLQKAGARITVVAPRVGEEIGAAIEAGQVAAVRRGFVSGDVNGQAIVFAATGLPAVDERVAEAARTAGVPVNVADHAGLSSFIVPAIVERDPLIRCPREQPRLDLVRTEEAHVVALGRIVTQFRTPERFLCRDDAGDDFEPVDFGRNVVGPRRRAWMLCRLGSRCLHGTFLPLTDLREAERALEEAQRLRRDLLNRIPTLGRDDWERDRWERATEKLAKVAMKYLARIEKEQSAELPSERELRADIVAARF